MLPTFESLNDNTHHSACSEASVKDNDWDSDIFINFILSRTSQHERDKTLLYTGKKFQLFSLPPQCFFEHVAIMRTKITVLKT